MHDPVDIDLARHHAGFFVTTMNMIEIGDCRETMRSWAAAGIRAQTCVTSPPYFGLRDYGHPGQLGLEQTPEEYIAAMVEWMADQQIKEATAAQAALESPVAWEWDSATHVLTTTNSAHYTAEDVLIDALDSSQDARDAYAELMASPAAAKLRQLLAEHWANKIWETRTHCEISAAIAAEREDF